MQPFSPTLRKAFVPVNKGRWGLYSYNGEFKRPLNCNEQHPSISPPEDDLDQDDVFTSEESESDYDYEVTESENIVNAEEFQEAMQGSEVDDGDDISDLEENDDRFTENQVNVSVVEEEKLIETIEKILHKVNCYAPSNAILVFILNLHNSKGKGQGTFPCPKRGTMQKQTLHCFCKAFKHYEWQ